MLLSVHMMGGRKMSITAVNPLMRIKDVRELLEQELGLLDSMRGVALVFESRELKDEETALSCGWESDSIVLAVVRVLPWKQADALRRALDSLITHPSGLEKRRVLSALQYFSTMPEPASIYTNLLVQCLDLESLKFGTSTFTRPIRVAAARALAKAAGPPGNRAEQIKRKLSDRSVMAELIEALGLLGMRNKEALGADLADTITNHLRDDSIRARVAAASALRMIGVEAKDTVRQLTSTLIKDLDASVRIAAAEALGALELGESSCKALQESASTDSDPGVRAASGASLRRAPKPN